jgi:hypothetical protein
VDVSLIVRVFNLYSFYDASGVMKLRTEEVSRASNGLTFTPNQLLYPQTVQSIDIDTGAPVFMQDVGIYVVARYIGSFVVFFKKTVVTAASPIHVNVRGANLVVHGYQAGTGPAIVASARGNETTTAVVTVSGQASMAFRGVYAA